VILPTKHISPNNSLIGVGATILRNIQEGITVTRLWECVKLNPEVATFERFILALDLLYIIGIIEFEKGLLKRRNYDCISEIQ
jgi:hypothetical protein